MVTMTTFCKTESPTRTGRDGIFCPGRKLASIVVRSASINLGAVMTSPGMQMATSNPNIGQLNMALPGFSSRCWMAFRRRLPIWAA